MATFKTGIVISGDDAGAVRVIQSVASSLGLLDRKSQESSAVATALSGSFGEVKSVLASLVGGLSVGAIFGGIISNTISAEQELAQLNAVLISTGQAAGFSAEQLQGMADSISKASTFSSGEIVSAQTRLLSYTNIVGEQFPQALQLAIDQAARLGISVEQSAEIVGRALQNPAKAMQALGRQGFELEDSQKALLQQFQDTGRTAEAQAIVMDLVAESYGGAAAAARNTLGGSLSALKNSFSDLLEGEGAGVTSATKAINEFSDALRSKEAQEAFSAAIDATFTTLTALGQGLSAAVQFVVEYQDEIAAAGVATLTFYGTLRAASALSALPGLVFGTVAALQAMTGAATAGATAVKVLSVAIRAISWPVALISAAAGALYYFSEGADEAAKSADGLERSWAGALERAKELRQARGESLSDQDVADLEQFAQRLAAINTAIADIQGRAVNGVLPATALAALAKLKGEATEVQGYIANLTKSYAASGAAAGAAADSTGILTDEQIRAQASNEEQIKLLTRTRELMLQGVAADEAATRAKLEQQGVDATRINVLVALEKQNKAYTAGQTAATKALKEHNDELAKYAKYVADQLEQDISAVGAAVARSDELADLQESLVLMQSGVALEEARYQIQLNRLAAQEAELRASAALQVNDEDRRKLDEQADKAAHERQKLLIGERIDGISAARDAEAQAAEQAAADWQRVADDINRALTDSLFRAFEDGANFGEAFLEGLENAAKVTVLKPLIEFATQPFTDGITALLGGGTGGAGSLGNLLGGDLASTFFDGAVLPLADVLGNAGFEELAVSITNFGANFAPLIGKAIPVAAAAYGVFEFAKSVRPANSNVGSTAYGLGALNTFTAPFVALDALGGGNVFGTGYGVDDVRLSGDFSGSGFEGDLTQYRSKKLSGGRGRRRRVDDLDETEFEAAFTEAISGAFSFAVEAADELGLSIESFVYSIDESIKGLSGDELAKKMEEILTGATDALAVQLLPGIAAFALENENLLQTLGRVSAETVSVERSLSLLGALGTGLEQVADAAAALVRIELSQLLIDAAGGFETFSANVTSFIDHFFTEAERFSLLQSGLTEALALEGFELPDTREAFRALLDGISVTTESGQAAFTTLTRLAGQADGYYDQLEDREGERQGLLDDVNERIRELTIPAEDLARLRLDESFAALYAEFERLDLDSAIIGPLYDLELAALSAGAAVSEAVDQFAEERAAFNADIATRSARQGLTGQDLDLFDLQREFQESLDEATRIGADIAAVEAYYGRVRQDIITRYASAAAEEQARIEQASAAGQARIAADLAAEQQRIAEQAAQDALELARARSAFVDGILTDIERSGLGGESLDLFDLDREFAGIRSEATELGVDLADIERLYGIRRSAIVQQYADEATRAAEEAAAEQQRIAEQAAQDALELARARSAFVDGILTDIQRSGLGGESLDLFDLDREFAGIRSEATELGVDLADIERLYGIRRSAIVQQYADEAARTAEEAAAEQQRIAEQAAQDALELARARSAFVDNVLDRLTRGDISGEALDLYNLEREFSGLRADAAELGLNDLLELDLLYAQERESIIQGYADAALDIERRAQEERLDQVRDAQDALRSAYEIEARDLQSSVDFFKDIGDELRSFRSGLNVGPAALLTSEAQYQSLDSRLSSLSAMVALGDLDALREFRSVAEEFLDVSQDRNASGAAYFADLDRIKAITDGAISGADIERNVQQASLDSLKQQVGQLVTLNERTQTVADAVQNLLAVQAAANAQMIALQSSLAASAQEQADAAILAN